MRRHFEISMANSEMFRRLQFFLPYTQIQFNFDLAFVGRMWVGWEMMNFCGIISAPSTSVGF
jgi:hypothetical protein